MANEGQRQRSSGALIFPVSPQQLKAEKMQEDLASELIQVKELKEELINLIKEHKK